MTASPSTDRPCPRQLASVNDLAQDAASCRAPPADQQKVRADLARERGSELKALADQLES